MREQFVVSCSKELTAYLKERPSTSIDELADLAERYTEAHGIHSFTYNGKSTNGRQQRSHDKPQDKIKKEVQSPISITDKKDTKFQGRRRCFICNSSSHLAKDCMDKLKKEQKGTSNALKTDSPNEEETDNPCGDTERNRLQNITAQCSPVNDGKGMPVTEGYVNGNKVKVLRDTGSDSVVVRTDLIKQDQMLGREKECRLVDKTSRKWPLAKVLIDTPYLVGNVEVMCVDTPVYDIIVGNVDGALKADEPNKEWEPSISIQMQEVHAVETRAQKHKKDLPILPLKTASQISEVKPSEMIKAQKEDPTLAHLWKKAKEDMDNTGKYRFIQKGEYLMRLCTDSNLKCNKRTQLVLPKGYRENVMKVAHDGIMSGHQGISRTLDRIQGQFYWPGMTEDVRHYCRSCDVCQRTIQKGKVGKVPLGRMPLIDEPFQRVNMDLVGPIQPISDRGNRYILTVVDYATRYPEAVALPNIETVTVAEALIDIYSRVGVPREVLSDMGSQFTSDLMREVSRLLSMKQKTTTPYHPMCSGLVERWNATLKQMLKRMCSERPKDWDRYINAVLFAYRETPNESLGFSPFEMLYGRSVRGPLTILRELMTKEEVDPDVKTTYQYVIDLKDRLSSTCDLAQQALSKSAGKYKKLYDRGKKWRTLEVGDRALILLPTDHNKLLLQWKGPFPVVAKFNDCDYQLDIKGKLKSFHINLLKKYVEREVTEMNLCIFDTMTPLDEDLVMNKPIVEPPSMVNLTDSNGCTDDINGAEFAEPLPLPSKNQNEFASDIHFGHDLSIDQRNELSRIVAQYECIFSDVPNKTNAIECSIKLTTDQHIKSKPYPVPYASREAMQKEIDGMLDLGIIERCNSPYASPLILVPKKDGTYRPCVDFRKLNRITVFDPEPMTNPEDLFQEIGEGKYFSKLDMTKGYWQVPMAEESKDLTAFVTPDAQYRFLYMPFGMVNSGAVFNRLVRKLFGGMKQVVHFIDDILVYTKTWKEHIEILGKVLHILQEANLSVKPSKCFLGYTNVEFLGHQVGEGILRTNPQLLKKIQDTERPITKKQLRSFLGLTGYYQKFVPNYAEIAVPLTDLTKKGKSDKLKWEEAQENSYRTLKTFLAKPPILRLPDKNKTYILKTDSSAVGWGAILLQEHDGLLYPVAYASRKLLPRESNYSAIELECLAIIWAIHKFELYLYGKNFEIQTDHRPLTYIQQAKGLNKRLMGWAMYLQGFRFRIVSVPGKENFGPDFLSRVPGDQYV